MTKVVRPGMSRQRDERVAEEIAVIGSGDGARTCSVADCSIAASLSVMSDRMLLRPLILFALFVACGGVSAQAACPISAAMTNVVDAAAAWAAFADYTNNVLRVETALASEWDDSNPRRKLDRFPANMPYQLVVGSDAADRTMAEAALETVVTSMPQHICSYFARHHLLAPVQQWVIRRAHPTVTNEVCYLSAAAHPEVWQAKDFSLSRIAAVASTLSSNTVPILANLHPIYEEFKTNPIRRAEPLVDYPDPRPEETYATPYGISVVLRAVERQRKFRFIATGYPYHDRNVSFKWVSSGVSVREFPFDDWRDRPKVLPSRGYGELVVNWWGARRDVLVFARYGDGPYGPPSVISICRVPNEIRKFGADGKIESMEYQFSAEVIPQLYQNKPWKDVYERDALGNVIGFLRTRAGEFRGERFTVDGEWVEETYAADVPKVTRKVRYFTRPDDPLTLDFEISGEKTRHKLQPFVPRDRGEFPPPRPRKR